MARPNPFTPTFGTVPAFLAGRDTLLADMLQAFQDGYGNPNLSTILIGARGTGKTALMACIRDEAYEAGWITASATALPGMLEDLYEQTVVASGHLLGKDASHKLTSLTLGPVSASWENQGADIGAGNWRTRMTYVLEQLKRTDTGLLITVDEVQADFDELVQLAATYQHFLTERRKVALVMAGLPYHVHRLISDKSVSFLRRSVQHQLGRIADSDIALALRRTVVLGEKSISDSAVDMCVRAIEGFAFMLQLVGYRTWLEASEESIIGVEHAKQGIRTAQSYMEQYVLASTYRELSDGDIRFLEAMTADPRESRLSDVAARMGVTNGYASKYKARLLASGIIGEPARGMCSFDIPGFREYVLARVAERGE